MKKATNPLALDLRAGGFGVFPIAKLFDLPSNVWYPSILRKCAFDCPRLECMEPETRGIPIFCNPEKRCLSCRLTCKHLTSCFAKSFLELETSSDRDGLDFVIRPRSGSRARKSSRFFFSGVVLQR